MNVYELSQDEDLIRYIVYAPDGLSKTPAFRHLASSECWTPPVLLRQQVNRQKTLGDTTTVNGWLDDPFWSDKARALLEPHLKDSGEFLPTQCEDATWWFFRVSRVIDALDEEASQITRTPTSSENFSLAKPIDASIVAIPRPVFRADRIGDAWIFKIPQRDGLATYVTDAFVKLIDTSQLKGFRFRRIWSSDEKVEPEAHPVEPVPAKPESGAPPHWLSTTLGDSMPFESRPIESPVHERYPDFEANMDELLDKARGMLGLEGKETPDEIVSRIETAVVARQKEQLSNRNPSHEEREANEEFARAMGALWARQLATELGWQWTLLARGASATPQLSLVTENRSLMLNPGIYIATCMAEPHTDCTIMLSYNMLQSGDIPLEPAYAFQELMGGVHRIVPR